MERACWGEGADCSDDDRERESSCSCPCHPRRNSHHQGLKFQPGLGLGRQQWNRDSGAPNRIKHYNHIFTLCVVLSC